MKRFTTSSTELKSTNGRWFDISSTFDKYVKEELSYDFLNGMQTLIEDPRTKMLGDKKSNFLDFKNNIQE